MTLTTLYEESNTKQAFQIVRVNGLPVNVRSCDVDQSMGVAASASFEVDNPVPATFVPETPVQIYQGYNGLFQLVFTGAIVGVSPRATGSSVQCAGEGRKLTRVYKRTVETITTQDVNDVIAGWLADAGITNFAVNLPAWTVGAVVPYVAEFTTYGDAINSLCMVDGDPWYETPSGQIRVEVKDPWPAPGAFRTYFSGALEALDASQRAQLVAGTLPAVDLQPAALQGVISANARPRIQFGITLTSLPQDTRNLIYVEGAPLSVPDGNGGTVTQRIEAVARAPSPFIVTPPGYRDISLDFPAIDTQAKADDTAFRYELKYNRLEQQVSIQVDADPELQIGMTVRVEDPEYTGITGRWFVYGIRHSMNSNGFTSALDLRGGVLAGSTPLLSPVADFIFSNQFLDSAKINQVVPADGASNIVTFDGRSSFDPDGTIASWDWADDQGNTGTGSVIQFSYPEATDTVVMTLTVTDNDGLTDSITKSVNLRLANDCGASDVVSTHIYTAIKSHASVSTDGGKSWTDKSKADLGVTGDITTVTAFYHIVYEDNARRNVIAFFGTTAGELIFTNDAFATFTVYTPTTEAIVALFGSDVYDSGVGDHYDSCWLVTASGRGFFFIFRYSNSDYGIQQGFFDGLATTGRLRPIVRAVLQTGQTQFSDNGPAAALIGGDSASPSSMLRSFNPSVSGTSVGGTFGFSAQLSGYTVPPFSAAMLAALAAAGPGVQIVDACAVVAYTLNGTPLTNTPTYLTVVFDDSVDPRVWSYDPFTLAWSPATGLTGGVAGISVAPGFEVGRRVVALDQLKTFTADDQVTFVEGSAGAPSKIRQLVYEYGLKDVYIAAADDGIVKSLDNGDTWGYIRPHAGEGTTWPAGADGKAVDIVFGGLPVGCANIYSLARDLSGNIEIVRLQGDVWTVVA